MTANADIVVLGLSLSSSWGNGHATTYRALLRGLAGLGYRVLFLERDLPWYQAHRDLTRPGFCQLAFYRSFQELRENYSRQIAMASAVIVGSYVPDGVAVLDFVLATAHGISAFYDIDTPITLAKLGRNDDAYVTARQVRDIDLYLSFTGGPTLRMLADRYGVKRAHVLYCAVDEDLHGPRDEPVTWDLGYLGTYDEGRQYSLERLLLEPARRLPKSRFVVAGSKYPKEIAWPNNVERIEHVSPSAHAGFYAAQRFTLNVTRTEMTDAGWSPSVRLFEAAACEAPIISDRWPGLIDLFPERSSIIIADDSETVIETLNEMTETTRRGIAEHARRIVMEAHTGRTRAGELVEYLNAASRHSRRTPHNSLRPK
jgi:spore maturation protein CgeB